MKSFIEYREWQDVKKLANRAANLMVELDVDVEDHISEFVESYDGELLEEGWWDNLKDKWKSSRLGGAVSAGLAAGKEQHGLPKFKFDKAMAGLQALVGSVPDNVAGMRSRNLKKTLEKLVAQLQGEKQAIDAVGPKAAEMTGISHADKKAARAPKTTSTQASIGEPDLGSHVQHVGAGVTPDGKAIVNPALAGESTQVVENTDAENTEVENTEVENTEVENTKKEYDPSKGSWYADEDGNIVPNMPPEDDQNGFFGSW